MTIHGNNGGTPPDGRHADRGHGHGARLWEAVRVLSDAERQQIQRALTRFRSLGEAASRSNNDLSGDDDDGDDNNNTRGDAVVVRLPSTLGWPAQEWAPLAFVQTLLEHLRTLAHEQKQVEVGADAVAAPSENAFSLQQEDFPSLGGSRKAVLKPETTTKVVVAAVAPVKATRRRITTTLISTDAPYAAVAVKPPTAAANEATPAQETSVWGKRELLERRMAAANSQNQPQNQLSEPSPVKATPAAVATDRRRVMLMGGEPTPAPSSDKLTKAQPLAKRSAWMSPPPPSTETAERKPPPLTLSGKQKRVNRVALTQPVDTSPDTKSASLNQLTPVPALRPAEPNFQAARIYGHLIGQRLAPSICSELQFLVGLLFRPTCVTGVATHPTDAPCTTRNEFCHTHASSAFAAAAIETLESTLVQLGSDMVQLVAKSLSDARVCEDLVSRLRTALEAREERRVEESAKMGCELPIETKVTAFRDYALPFCEDMDSRLNYRTPTESVIYSNREKTRDAFLSQLRAYQKKQNSLLGSVSDAAGAASPAQVAQQLLQEVMPENLWWFARFFVLELVQIGSNPLGESDKDLVLKMMEDKTLVKNPDRLRKLHRRFTSQKVLDPATGGSTTTGFQSNRSKVNHQFSCRQGGNGGGGSSSNKGDNTKSRTVTTGGNSNNNVSTADSKSASAGNMSDAASSVNQMRGFFSDNQAFFFHFLSSCDSYQFAELVKYQLEAQFMTIWRTTPKNDPRKEFTEVVLRLKVLAKFMGFLRFSPQWHWAALTSALSSKNPALETAQREAVASLDQSASANAFDVLSLLEESIVTRSTAKCVPWLCDYLSMLSSDAVSSSTKHFQRVLLLLMYLHRSHKLDRLGETGLYVAMQIERLFQLLAVDDLLPRVLRWHRLQAKPPTWVKPATVRALFLDQVNPTAECIDELPFLYSSMFVQVCISELDDLRGFIQTRANPQHRTAATSSRRGQLMKTQSIRKVRPLQVLSEEQLDLSSSAQGAATGEREENEHGSNQRADRENNPLRDAFFKLYPQLKRAVEFVVDMVVTNMCEHAISKYVKPNADALIDSCVDDAKVHAPSFTQLILHEFQVRLNDRLENFMATTVAKALDEATQLCVERVEAALRPLIAPSTPMQLVAAATTIAQAQATAATTSLITRSLRTEFLKRVAVRKRSIVKEAGASASLAAAGSDEVGNQDVVARALKFSFDDSMDANQSPLEEAMQSVKANVTAMHNLLQPRPPSHAHGPAKRSMASFMRFHRAFLGGLDDAISALEFHSQQPDLTVVLWSWIWRAVQLSVRAVAALVAAAAVDVDAASKEMADAAQLREFVTAIAKTLRATARLETQQRASTLALCRFVAEHATSIPEAVATEPETHLPAAAVDACADLLAATKAVMGETLFSSASTAPSLSPRDGKRDDSATLASSSLPARLA